MIYIILYPLILLFCLFHYFLVEWSTKKHFQHVKKVPFPYIDKSTFFVMPAVLLLANLIGFSIPPVCTINKQELSHNYYEDQETLLFKAWMKILFYLLFGMVFVSLYALVLYTAPLFVSLTYILLHLSNIFFSFMIFFFIPFPFSPGYYIWIFLCPDSLKLSFTNVISPILTLVAFLFFSFIRWGSIITSLWISFFILVGK